MDNKLVITKYKNNIVSLHYEDGELSQIVPYNPLSESILGNIYIGKVVNIVKNIEAAFIEIENKVMCYYSLTKEVKPIFLNDKKSDRIVIGDELLVQVVKEAINQKAPVVSSFINITGRYSVLTHGKTSLSVSNKIDDNEYIKTLKKIMAPYSNADYGLIIRTNSIYTEFERINLELQSLIDFYHTLINKSKYLSCFSCVYKAPLSYICDIRDSYSNSFDKIITDIPEIYTNISDYLSNFQSEDINKLKFYDDEDINLDILYNINSSINDALKTKIWLKSGGTIVIEPTEALVAIDVNTSRAIIGKGSPEKTFLKINLEAAKEIARQLKLRNLGGIVIVDFIDMQKEEDKRILLDEFERLLSKDQIKTTLIDITGLNLVEVTRKKVRKPIYQQLL